MPPTPSDNNRDSDENRPDDSDAEDTDRLTSESRPDHVTEPITPTSNDMADPPSEHRADQTGDGQAQGQDDEDVVRVDFEDLNEDEKEAVIEATRARDREEAGLGGLSEEFIESLNESNREKIESHFSESDSEGDASSEANASEQPTDPNESAISDTTVTSQAESNTPGEASVKNSDPNVTEVAPSNEYEPTDETADSANVEQDTMSNTSDQSQGQTQTQDHNQAQNQSQEQGQQREFATQEEVEEARRKRAEKEAEDESPPKETGRFASLKQPAEDYYIKVRGEKFRVSDPAERGEDASMDEIASDLQNHLRDHIEEHGQVDTSKMDDEELDDLLYSMVSLVVEEEIPRADWDEFYDGPKTALANGVMQYVQNHVSGFTLQRANGERPGARG